MRVFLALMALFAAQIACADSIDRILGTWETTDGAVRQTFERGFGRHWVKTNMWFLIEGEWRHVSTGAMYRRPGNHIWRGATRSTNMDGVELFEFTLEMTTEGEYALDITAYMDTGLHFKTAEEWFFDGYDSYRNVIYRFDEGDRTRWMEGQWVRSESAED